MDSCLGTVCYTRNITNNHWNTILTRPSNVKYEVNTNIQERYYPIAKVCNRILYCTGHVLPSLMKVVLKTNWNVIAECEGVIFVYLT